MRSLLDLICWPLRPLSFALGFVVCLLSPPGRG